MQGEQPHLRHGFSDKSSSRQKRQATPDLSPPRRRRDDSDPDSSPRRQKRSGSPGQKKPSRTKGEPGRVVVLSLLIVAGCLVCGGVCMVLGVSSVGSAVCQQGMVAGSLLPLVKLVPVILPVISLSRVNLQVSWVRLNFSERKA